MLNGIMRPGPLRIPEGLGLGLGLYIVQQIVHAHGGSVEVQSGNAGPTVFRVTVPRAPRT